MTKPSCIVTQTDKDFMYWSGRPHLTNETREAIRHSDIVIVPDEGFRNHIGPVFPVRTEELFQYLRQQAQRDLMVELGVEDADYNEVALHSDLILIATALVKNVVAPAAVSFIAAYLKKRLGNRFKTDEVRFKLLVEDTDGKSKRTRQISYEGPAATFESTLKQAVQQLAQSDTTEDGVEVVGPSTDDDADANRRISQGSKDAPGRSDT